MCDCEDGNGKAARDRRDHRRARRDEDGFQRGLQPALGPRLGELYPRPFDLHRLAYYPVRAAFGLPAQLTVRAIKVVADSYKADRSRQHIFGTHAAVVYDARVFKLIGQGEAELTTVHGRKRFALALGARQRAQLLAGTIGEADRLSKGGGYYLAITVKTPAPPPASPAWPWTRGTPPAPALGAGAWRSAIARARLSSTVSSVERAVMPISSRRKKSRSGAAL